MRAGSCVVELVFGEICAVSVDVVHGARVGDGELGWADADVCAVLLVGIVDGLVVLVLQDLGEAPEDGEGGDGGGGILAEVLFVEEVEGYGVEEDGVDY